MNSSIFNSSVDIAPEKTNGPLWSRWLIIFLSVTIMTGLALWGAVIVLDPFSTGRLTPIRRIDIVDDSRLFGDAARARDPRFNSAILGNSHAVPLDPKRIGDATGLRFAQFSDFGLSPVEQFIMGRAFLHNHPDAAAIVVVLDDFSCSPDDRVTRPFASFPAFLFEGSNWNYVRHIVFPEAIKTAARRLGILLTLVAEVERIDGFDPASYSPLTRPMRQARIAAYRSPTEAPEPGMPPALPLFEAFVAELPPQTALVLYFSPVPANTLPVPGSAAARWLDACKAQYRSVADARRRSVFMDRFVKDAFTDDIHNFEDVQHIRNDRAPVLEADIINALGMKSQARMTP